MSTNTTVSPLRQRRRFAKFLKRSPDTATADDVRRFQLHLVEAGLSVGNRNRIMTGVKFLFRVTLRRLDLQLRSRANARYGSVRDTKPCPL
ncbi:MAG TPA: phage integrase N-terminal SAM-like domain-containing protein [Terriglobales bacterium]|nr:phage integrase N-terminal SAM-like domain-containing protein [Terriglobales bacterium]